MSFAVAALDDLDDAPASLWAWAVAAYARPGVKAACLSLQDDFELDVDMLLWLMWLADLGTSPTSSSWEQAALLSEDWRAHVFGPLRRARRALNAPRRGIDDAGRRELYSAALDLELKLERALLDALARLGSQTAAGRDDPARLARDHLETYALGAGAERELDALVAAVFA